MLYFAPWKTVLILAVILIGFVFTLPNFVPESVRYDSDGRANAPWTVLPNQTINLGLDLQGGSHLVFQVDLDEVRQDRLSNLQEDVRALFRRAPPILSAPPAVIDNQVVVRLSDPADMERAIERLDEINERVSGAGGQAGTARTLNIQDAGDGRTIAVEITQAELDSIRKRTVQQSIEIIRRRIDGMGTTEPVIARQGDDRVLVQVPGESDP